jgi:thioredoxin-related protein
MNDAVMCKKIISLTIASFLFLFVAAQQNTKTAIAPFSIEQANGKTFTYKELKKNIPATLIYFSPTCDHCKEFLKDLLQHKKELATKQIVMVTYLPVNELKPFVTEFNLEKYNNIKVGTEGYTFIVRKYYNVERFPFVAVYNSNLQLKKILPYSEDASKTVAQLVKFW